MYIGVGQGTCKKSRPLPAWAYTTLVVLVFSQENEAPTPVQTQEEKDFVMIPQKLDVNFYNTKKSMAQGMMDIALLSANAAHLKYILQVLYNALLPLSIL